MPHAPADAPQPPRPSLLAALAQYRDARRRRAHLDAAVAADRARRAAGTDADAADHHAHRWDPDRDDLHGDRTDGPPDVVWERDRDLPLVAWALGGWVMALAGLAVGSPWVCLTGMVAHLAAVFAFALAARPGN